MATVDVPWDWFVFKMKAYQYIVQVTKFELSTAYRFSTAEGRTSLWTDSTPPPPGLFRVLEHVCLQLPNFAAMSSLITLYRKMRRPYFDTSWLQFLPFKYLCNTNYFISQFLPFYTIFLPTPFRGS